MHIAETKIRPTRISNLSARPLRINNLSKTSPKTKAMRVAIALKDPIHKRTSTKCPSLPRHITPSSNSPATGSPASRDSRWLLNRRHHTLLRFLQGASIQIVGDHVTERVRCEQRLPNGSGDLIGHTRHAVTVEGLHVERLVERVTRRRA